MAELKSDAPRPITVLIVSWPAAMSAVLTSLPTLPATCGGLDEAALRERVEAARRLSGEGRAQEALDLIGPLLAQAGLPDWAQAPLHAAAAMGHFDLGNVESSLQHTLAALDGWQRLDDRRSEARSLSLYTWLMTHIGELDKAVECGFRALGLAEALDDAGIVILILNALGGAYIELPEQHTQCHATFERALALARERGDPNEIIQSLGNLGSAYDRYATRLWEAGRRDEAIEWGLRAIDLSEQTLAIGESLGNLRYCAMAQINIVDTAAVIGQTDKAHTHLEPLLERARQLEDRRLHGYALYVVGHLRFVEGDLPAACALLEQACALADEAKLNQLTTLCCNYLGAAYEQREDFRNALRYAKRSFELREQAASETAQRRGRALAVLHETEKAKARAEAEHLRAEALSVRNHELDQRARRFAHDAEHDALTGLYNRRRFDQALAEALAKPQPQMYLALLDIDHFKRINDTYSHQCGDDVLRHIGQLLAGCVRDGDHVFRYGGEEFAVIFAGMDDATAEAACERVRCTVERFDWGALTPGLKVTVSMGLAHASPTQAARSVLGKADERLYLAKAGGRNRVVAH
jgi:two-component system cell cycle response regulator